MSIDLKDFAEKVAQWRVEWDLISGSPRHAVIPLDANTFDSPSVGYPFGMKLAQAGQASAAATLHVDLREESQMATLMPGPWRTAEVRVRAKVITAEPPSPLLLTRVTSLMGTFAALVDLSVGWVQTTLPPTSTTVIRVERHEAPTAIDATLSLSMSIDAPHLRGTAEMLEHHTIAGNWSTRLEHSVWTAGADKFDRFIGSGLFRYTAVSRRERTDAANFFHRYAHATRDGMFDLQAGPTVMPNGNILRDGPVVATLSGGQLGSGSCRAEDADHAMPPRRSRGGEPTLADRGVRRCGQCHQPGGRADLRGGQRAAGPGPGTGPHAGRRQRGAGLPGAAHGHPGGRRLGGGDAGRRAERVPDAAALACALTAPARLCIPRLRPTRARRVTRT